MSKGFAQKLRDVASETEDLLSSCDASDLIDGLKVARDHMFFAANEIEELESRLEQAEWERDAAVADLKNVGCFLCKHAQKQDFYIHDECLDCVGNSKFEWRGVCPENTKEKSIND